MRRVRDEVLPVRSGRPSRLRLLEFDCDHGGRIAEIGGGCHFSEVIGARAAGWELLTVVVIKCNYRYV